MSLILSKLFGIESYLETGLQIEYEKFFLPNWKYLSGRCISRFFETFSELLQLSAQSLTSPLGLGSTASLHLQLFF
jgi:hypothetical protein